MPPKRDLQFGRTFSDHMLSIEYADGKWKGATIGKFENLKISPAASSLHYGECWKMFWANLFLLL